jgi:hypothetical protein
MEPCSAFGCSRKVDALKDKPMHDADRTRGTRPSEAAPSADVTSSPRKPLTPAAQRALAEAAARRAQAEKTAAARPPELHGPRGPEPTRFGDWERKGIASDF